MKKNTLSVDPVNSTRNSPVQSIINFFLCRTTCLITILKSILLYNIFINLTKFNGTTIFKIIEICIHIFCQYRPLENVRSTLYAQNYFFLYIAVMSLVSQRSTNMNKIYLITKKL